MRKLTVLLMLLVAVSFASDASSAISPEDNTETTSTGYVAPLGSKAVLFDQAYDGLCDNGRWSSGVWRQADDFSLTNPGRIENLEWWSLYTAAPGSDYNVRIYDDNSGEPGTMLWEVAAITPTDTDTGDDAFGYDIYHTAVTLDTTDYFLLEDGTTYWLSAYWSSDRFYWTVWDGGNMMESNNDGPWSTNSDIAMFRLNGTEDLAAPEVSGQVPADGASGVAVNSDIVFHVTDDCFGVDTSTIAFSVEDSAKSNGVTASLSSVGHTGAITGALVVDDTDLNDVICTFTPDSDLPPDTITCTVAAGLADDAGNATGADIVWSFDTVGSNVEETTWGQIKAL